MSPASKASKRTLAQDGKPAENKNAALIDDLREHPGYLFRRAQQISTSVFYEKAGNEVTPIQYALLRTLKDNPGVDQVTLASLVGLDTSTTAATATRMEEKGLIVRRLEVVLRRQRRLFLTPEGDEVLASLGDAMAQMREQLLGRMAPQEQEALMSLLRKFVEVNNDFSRAPLGGITRAPKRKVKPD